MATTTYGVISQRTAAWAASVMLDHARPVIVLGMFGQSKPLPRNKANAVKFRKPTPFAAATTPLTEGTTPTAQAMAYTDVTATLAQYGAVTEITDVVMDLAEDQVLKEASMLSGEQAGETIEAITYGVIKAGTAVTYANGSARNAVNTVITLAKQRLVIRTLKNQKARPINSILGPSQNISSVGIEAGYIAVAHTDCEQDIRDLAGFVPVVKYGTRKPCCDEEIGSVENVRYVLSPDLESFADAGGAKGLMYSTTGTSADVYPVIYLGREAYGVVPLKGKGAIKPMVLNADTPSKSDPLGQMGYVSWKCYFTAVILNQNWMNRLEVAVLAL